MFIDFYKTYALSSLATLTSTKEPAADTLSIIHVPCIMLSEWFPAVV